VVGSGLHRAAGHDGPEDPETLDVEHARTLQHCFIFRK
jgi:hypothetical protein